MIYNEVEKAEQMLSNMLSHIGLEKCDMLLAKRIRRRHQTSAPYDSIRKWTDSASELLPANGTIQFSVDF